MEPKELLFDILKELSLELRQRSREVPISPASLLSQDLSIDSLARTELLARVEKKLAVRLDEEAVMTAETAGDLLKAVVDAMAGQGASRFVIHTAPQLKNTGAVEEPHFANTLGEVLESYAANYPDRCHVILLSAAGEELITFKKLYQEALKVSQLLLAERVTPDETVALMFPTGFEFLAAFFGVILIGAVPVPLYPPASVEKLAEHLKKQASILKNCEAKILLTVSEARLLGSVLKAHVPTLEKILTPGAWAEKPARESRKIPVQRRADDLAFLQYTSGSTGEPKGVMLSHRNLLANIRAMGQVVKIKPDDVFVSWLPLYHDMGLIGAWLGSLYYGATLVLMSPVSFIARPALWLDAITKYHATISGGPNFAYQLCVNRIEESEIAKFDLSSWRFAFNGAEPVSAVTVSGFKEKFARCGFKAAALSAVYGLAEDSVGLCMPEAGKGCVVDQVNREMLQRGGRAVPEKDEGKAMQVVGCGPPLPGHEVRIVDALGFEVSEREEGRLQFKGPSASAGYYKNSEATATLRQGAWSDSGDFAYVAEGQIFITGRAKDLIIRAGRNVYPQDLEALANQVEGVRKGCVAAFASVDRRSGTEKLIVAAESRENDAAAQEKIKEVINVLVTEAAGLPADEILLLPPRSVPKTSSGKIRRSECRRLYETGRLKGGGGKVRQAIALLLAAGPGLSDRTLNAAKKYGYAAWFWLCMALIIPCTWLLVLLMPSLSARRKIRRVMSRTFLKMVFIKVELNGRPQTAAAPSIVVCNHQSYMDGLILCSTLPPDISFVAKKELSRNWFLKILFRRLGDNFVERFDFQESREDFSRLLTAAVKNEHVVFFPEGTFRRTPGLGGFKPGAFLLATEAGRPVLPVCIRGSRGIQRGDELFPRHASVAVTIGEPITGAEKGWEGAMRLLKESRSFIARHCGEAEL